MHKIHYPKHLLFDEHRNSLFEILKSKFRLTEKQKEVDINLQKNLNWVEDSKNAEFWVLPHDWNHYYQRGMQSEALAFCAEAEKQGKMVLSATGGDQGITVPVGRNTIVYRQSGYRSSMRPNERCAPFFLSDPVTFFIPQTEAELLNRNRSETPVVGFCGMAPHGLLIDIKERLQIIRRNIRGKWGEIPYDAQAVMSSSNLRFNILQRFRESPTFDTNYIIRQKYRGGVQTPENRAKTTAEYYQNQVDSDLITCARGVGNFSLRFYETLAMGRIPVFVDTDSPLPEIDGDWNEYIIWVDRKEVHRAPEIATQWLKNKNLTQQFQKNRDLWLREFRLDNFWCNQLKRLNKQ